MDSRHVEGQLAHVLLTEEELHNRIAELALQIAADYPEDQDLLLVGVLKGAVMVMADLARALPRQAQMDWMAVSSYGSGTMSSGVVRILKDLDTDIVGRNVLVVEDILDSGLTLSWLLKNLGSRKPKSIEVFTLLRKPEGMKMKVDAKYVGFDIPNEFVVGYGLDYDQNYRNLRSIGTLAPHVYES
ncbi:MAG: hypoxanthine phosphoribosyltransferase [Candidatus Nanopelagicales bacterium]